MSWDISLSPTGDWLFSGNRDILHVDGPPLLKQRIMTRLKIPRGSFVGDEDGDLGSDLNLALRYNADRAQREIPMMVEEALEPMSNEVSLSGVSVAISTDERQATIDIRFIPVSDDVAVVLDETEEESLLVSI